MVGKNVSRVRMDEPIEMRSADRLLSAKENHNKKLHTGATRRMLWVDLCVGRYASCRYHYCSNLFDFHYDGSVQHSRKPRMAVIICVKNSHLISYSIPENMIFNKNSRR